MSIGKGFVLTRQAKDINGRMHIELWLSTATGAQKLIISSEFPTFFIAQDDIPKVSELLGSNGITEPYIANDADNSHQNVKPNIVDQQQLTIKLIPLNSFNHKSIAACYCPNIRYYRDLVQLLKQHDIETLEDDIRPADRYLMERFIQGGIEFDGVYTPKQNYSEISQAQCRKGDYYPTLTSVSLDLECSENGLLYSVGLASSLDTRVIMVGKPPKPLPTVESVDLPTSTPHIQWVDNEVQLLIELNHWFEQFDPDLIYGWNVINFDFKLLVKRAELNKVKLTLGRAKQSVYLRQLSQSQQSFITIPGRVVLDGIDSLKAAAYQFRSWSLESVSQELLGEGKAVDNVHNRMAEINHMFQHDKLSLAKYNIQDCHLVNKIFANTHLLEFLIQRSKLTGLELDRQGGSVAAFTNLYLPRLHRAGYIAPNLHPENWLASPGGYVMDSLPGLYDSVLVLDFKSLYPAIIRSFLIDPLGLVEGLKLEIGKEQQQAVAGFKGGQFHRKRHFLPDMIKQLWHARDMAKANQQMAFSQAIKIIMNSFYGVLGSSGCRFFDQRLASSITMRGHQIMKMTKSLIEEKGYQVIYGDTDSIFVSINHKASASEADQIGHQLVEWINGWWQAHLQQEYGLTSCLELEYETHFKKFLMPTIRGSDTGSKKRYAGLIQKDTENAAQGKEEIVFKGLESARSDWTPLAQTFQNELYQLIFHEQDPTHLIQSYVTRTQNGEFDHLLTYQKRLRRKLADYVKNVPPQVRAARLADEINQKLGRPMQYQNRGSISYIMTINGPEPSEYLQSNINYQHYIDKQLKPIAEAILPFIGLDFEQINAPQLGLF